MYVQINRPLQGFGLDACISKSASEQMEALSAWNAWANRYRQGIWRPLMEVKAKADPALIQQIIDYLPKAMIPTPTNPGGDWVNDGSAMNLEDIAGSEELKKLANAMCSNTFVKDFLDSLFEEAVKYLEKAKFQTSLVRFDKSGAGFRRAIQVIVKGTPRKGEDVPFKPTAEEGPSTVMLIGVGAVVLLGGAAFLMMKKQRSASA